MKYSSSKINGLTEKIDNVSNNSIIPELNSIIEVTIEIFVSDYRAYGQIKEIQGTGTEVSRVKYILSVAFSYLLLKAHNSVRVHATSH